MIAVLDHGMGNRRSVQKALEHVGATVQLTADPERIAAADGLVIPGVGAFGAGMASLRERELVAPIRQAAADGRPLLGICLGMQLLLDSGTELGEHPGLGLIPGTVTRLRTGEPPLRVPHIGWNEVRPRRPGPFGDALPAGGAAFYHVHSYAARPAREADVVAETTYGETFASVIAHGAVLGVQFHPEKSSGAGLALLAAFARMCAPTAVRA